MTTIEPGLKIGKLSVLSQQGRHRCGDGQWLVKCDCGSVRVMIESNLKRPAEVKSCGCTKTKHGMWRMRSYEVWAGMMKRCYNEGSVSFKRYGRRGIKVCDRWHDFEAFVADMGERPKGLSLDRINNNGDYSPGNCRWATNKQQSRNKSTNRVLRYNGEEKLLVDWAEETGISAIVISARLNKLGWSVEKALTTKVMEATYPPKNDLMKALATEKGNKSAAARALGITRDKVYASLRYYGERA